jgi:hypothetical protein
MVIRSKAPDQVQQSNDTHKVSPTTPLNTSTEEQIELHTLREKVKYLESLRETEKRSLEDQIDLLKNLLESERAEKNKATALLTDQRSGAEKASIAGRHPQNPCRKSGQTDGRCLKEKRHLL